MESIGLDANRIKEGEINCDLSEREGKIDRTEGLKNGSIVMMMLQQQARGFSSAVI